MRYSRSTSSYPERILLSNPTHTMSIVDLVTVGMKILRIDSTSSLKKEFAKLIDMNPQIVLYLIINQINLCRNYVCDPLT